MDPASLATALVDGALPKELTPHSATLLDEAPMSLIVAALEEVAISSSTSPRLVDHHDVNLAMLFLLAHAARPFHAVEEGVGARQAKLQGVQQGQFCVFTSAKGAVRGEGGD
jgi:hypothetical protein